MYPRGTCHLRSQLCKKGRLPVLILILYVILVLCHYGTYLVGSFVFTEFHLIVSLFFPSFYFSFLLSFSLFFFLSFVLSCFFSFFLPFFFSFFLAYFLSFFLSFFLSCFRFFYLRHGFTHLHIPRAILRHKHSFLSERVFSRGRPLWPIGNNRRRGYVWDPHCGSWWMNMDMCGCLWVVV